MSCILFSRISFLALAGDTSFQHLCTQASLKSRGIADSLFTINVRAYRARYGNGTDVESDVKEAETDSHVDYEFLDYLKGEADMGTLLSLLKRIDYQYCEEGIYESDEYKSRFLPLFERAKLIVERKNVLRLVTNRT